MGARVMVAVAVLLVLGCASRGRLELVAGDPHGDAISPPWSIPSPRAVCSSIS